MSKKVVTENIAYRLSLLHTFHVSMWQWLADHPDKQKRDWPHMTHATGTLLSAGVQRWVVTDIASTNCFACAACLVLRNTVRDYADSLTRESQARQDASSDAGQTYREKHTPAGRPCHLCPLWRAAACQKRLPADTPAPNGGFGACLSGIFMEWDTETRLEWRSVIANNIRTLSWDVFDLPE